MTLISFELPFHIGMADEPTNGAFPDALPFALGQRPDLGLLIQVPDVGVVEQLDRVYRRGSMLGTPLSAEGLGRSYADDFLGFIRESVPRRPKAPLSLLEIGCGSGYLLGRMRDLGANVIGVEPGPQATLGRTEHDIEIIQEPFLGPQQFGERRFDVILHHCVLEHVPDPVGFLRIQRQMLTPGGRLLIGVPDEEPYLAAGDISTLAHQHWSYFTEGSLTAILAASGFEPTRVVSAGFGGAMYAAAEPSVRDEHRHEWEPSRFADTARDRIAALERFFAEMDAAGRTVGLWPGARAVNYLHILRPRVPIRLFDDDGLLTRKYYPPIPVPVETRAQLLARPVDELVMLTRAFGAKLRSELQVAPRLERTAIRLLDEIV